MENRKSRIDAHLTGAENVMPKKKGKRVCWISIGAVLVITVALYAVFGLILPARREANQMKAENARLEALYTEAVQLNKNGAYMQAYAAFTELGAYKDSAQQAQAQREAQYALAVQLQEDGKYIDAHAAFEPLGDYKDCAQQKEYTSALIMEHSGDTYRAATAFYALGDYRDSWQRCFALWGTLARREVISTNDAYAVAATESGVLRGGGKLALEAEKWNNIVAISSSKNIILGLRDDGIVEFASRGVDISQIANWTDIVAISAGENHVVGLKADGSVVATGSNDNGQCDVSEWKGVVAVAAGPSYTAVVLKNGELRLTKNNFVSSTDRAGTRGNVVAISANVDHFVGLKTDGTVFARGDNTECQCMVSDWKDIVAVSAGATHTVGLKADGTVVAAGYNTNGECNVSDWINIVAVSAGDGYTVGLKQDGTVVLAGDNVVDSQFRNWTDVRSPEVDLTTPIEKEAGVLNQVGDNLYVPESSIEEETIYAVRKYELQNESVLWIGMFGNEILAATDADRFLLISPEDGTITYAKESTDKLTDIDWKNCCVTEDEITYYNLNRRDVVTLNTQLEEIRRTRLMQDTDYDTPRINPVNGEIYTCEQGKLCVRNPKTGDVRWIDCKYEPKGLTKCTVDGKFIGYYVDETTKDAYIKETRFVSTQTGEFIASSRYILDLETYGDLFFVTEHDIHKGKIIDGVHYDITQRWLLGNIGDLSTTRVLNLQVFYLLEGYSSVDCAVLLPTGDMFVPNINSANGRMRLSLHSLQDLLSDNPIVIKNWNVRMTKPVNTPQAISDGKNVWLCMQEQGKDHAALYCWDLEKSDYRFSYRPSYVDAYVPIPG